MKELYLGKCRYCGTEIPYEEGQASLIKCPNCGETLVIAEFLNEQLKIKKALEEGEEAKKALEEAVAERENARNTLIQTISSLENIEDNQEAQKEKLLEILNNQKADQEVRDSALQLLQSLHENQTEENSQVNQLFQQVMLGQETAEEKLNALKTVSDQMSRSQNDISLLLRSVSDYLSTETVSRNKQISDLVLWARTAHQEDLEWLHSIAESADRLSNSLNASQEAIENRISTLQATVDRTAQAVERFETGWKQSEIDKLVELYHQAENYQLERSFDKAGELYRQVLTLGGKEPEVYWRIILCHYCVVYQRDNEDNRVLTVLYPDLTDPAEMPVRKDFATCVKTPEQQKYYQTELKRLDTLLNKYRAVRFQVQYDVFLSVKQTVVENGKRFYTQDREMGLFLYNHLTSLGLKVFNSEAPQCKCPPGQEWEPYILAALLSSKVMIVVGTCAEHMESQWIKNEWSRYQWLQKHENEKGKTERRLLCYISDSMNPYDMPKGLNPIQAIPNNAVAFDTLDREMKKSFPDIKEQPEPPTRAPVVPEKPVQPVPVQPVTDSKAAQVVAKMQAWLTLGKYSRIRKLYDQLVSNGECLDCCRIHLYAICADYHIPEIRLLTNAPIDLLKDKRFQLARRCAKTPDEIQEIEYLIAQCKNAEPDHYAGTQTRKWRGNKLTLISLAMCALLVLFEFCPSGWGPHAILSVVLILLALLVLKICLKKPVPSASDTVLTPISKVAGYPQSIQMGICIYLLTTIQNGHIRDLFDFGSPVAGYCEVIAVVVSAITALGSVYTIMSDLGRIKNQQ